MNISDNLAQTVDALLAARRPFAIYGLPGAPVRLVRPDDDSVFAMCPWGAGASQAVRLDTNATAPAVLTHSTARDTYYKSVAAAMTAHTPESGKTVISRVICGTARNSCGKAAEYLFNRFPETFRYVCWSPATGGWIGATPELLARFHSGIIETMALAGTKPSSGGMWDKKNRREQEMVTRFIAGTLRHHCPEVRVQTVRTLYYGHICHLCSDISARMNTETDIHDIIDDLNPTPAVAGYPRDEAVPRIAALESHPRRFYAGYIEIDDDSGHSFFVNLRCANFDPDSSGVCIYAGGGITALSDPDTEWDESARKAEPLINAFNL